MFLVANDDIVHQTRLMFDNRKYICIYIKILVELETMWKHDFWKIERVYSQPRLRPCAVRGSKQA